MVDKIIETPQCNAIQQAQTTSSKMTTQLNQYLSKTVSTNVMFSRIYRNCICTFQSFNAMKTHLSRSHNECRINATEGAHAFFTCPLCDFKQPFSEATLFGHLRSHLRSREMVACPFKNCNYRTNVYSSFNAHKSREHVGSSDFGDNVVLADNDSAPVINTAECVDEGPAQCESADTFDLSEVDSQFDTDTLRAQLHHNLASLFLKMPTILHVSDMASQEIVEHLTQIFSLSQPLLKKTIREVLQSHDISASETTLDEVVSAVMDSNILVSATAKRCGTPFPSLQPREGKPLSRKITLWSCLYSMC